MKGRLQTAAAVAALLAAGFLLGSFWLEWREPRLGEAGAGVGGAPSSASSLPEEPARRPRVEVLNGLGRPGAARRAAEMLRDMGFDVVYFGNADRFDHETTRILARSTDRTAVRRIADSLGVRRVSHRPAPSLYVDGTVVLGADWDSLRAARDSADAAGDGTPLEGLAEMLGL